MEIFFEYQKKKYEGTFLKSQKERDTFKSVLNKLWAERKQFGLTSVYFDDDETQSEQQFFTFYDTYIKAGNYIGCIKYGDRIIQILPKTLESGSEKLSDYDLLNVSNKNLLWWLSRCSRIKFPRTFSDWDMQSFNFLDILIHLFAALTRDDLIFNKHLAYIEKEEPLETLRGRIDFTKYATNYYTGNAHILPCVYDSLEIDNKYNQIIKFTSRLLFHNTDNEDIKKHLQEIIWILDDVEDVFMKTADCDQVVVSPLNDNMQVILDYCRMFLSGMSISTDDESIEIFTFLIPAEKLFEDFIFGFIKDEFENIKGIKGIQSQGDENGKQRPLAVEKNVKGEKVRSVFNLKPDIYICRDAGDIILDTKYKVIYTAEEAEDNNRNETGVSINDIYQMLAYTVRLKVNTCHLLYPISFGTEIKLSTHFEISHYGDTAVSKVFYHRLPTLIGTDEGELSEIIYKHETDLFNHLRYIICV